MRPNKALHPYGAQSAPRVNADVGHMKSITGMRVLLIMAVLVLAMGCHRGAITSHSATARDLENELFPLDPTQLFARGITEVNDGVDQPYWMLANFMDSDTISEGFIRELFKQNDIAWQGSGNMGMWAVYVAKTDFPRAQVLLMECKHKNGLNLRVWHPGESKEEIDEWMSNKGFQAIGAKARLQPEP